jgi:FkbM family methyltransferase
VVQVGANDGVANDPIRQIIRQFALPALLIEPLPDRFEQLVENYKNDTQVICERCAIDITDGYRTMYRISPQAQHYPVWAQGLATFDLPTLLKVRAELPDVADSIEQLEVPTSRLDSLLTKHKIESLLLLQVDAEGYDYTIVRNVIECNLLPPLIHYEYIHLSFQDQYACRELLSSHGYLFLNCHGEDTLAVQKTVYASL